MGRRKIPHVVKLDSGESYLGRSSANLCPRDFLEDKYEEAIAAVRPVTLYADSTLHHVDRIRALFEEYCSLLHLDPPQILQECVPARMENFLHWMLKTYTIKKTSTVTTYWRQLSQLHILWTQRRIDPQVLRQIFVFIEGPLTKEYGLDNMDTEKPLLEAEEFVELIRYHWASDINVFQNERQRLQLAAILLLAAFTGSRPHALLCITYRDLDLYVERDQDTDSHHVKLGVKLTKTKSGKKRKRPKTYTFNLDDNPVFCIITHLVGLAFDDEAFAAPGLVSPDILFRLKAEGESGCQQIPFKQDILDTLVFRRALKTKQGVQTSPTAGLIDSIYQSWVKRLGEALGYVQTLTTYCLRRALGNAVNDDPNSNAAVRNLVLDHVGSSAIFERNYLSRIIRYSTQDAFWHREPSHESAKAASRIGRLRDRNRPKKLTEEQSGQVREAPAILDLLASRDRLRMDILGQFGALKMAEGEPIYDDYQALGRAINSTVRTQERALLRHIQEEYDVTAPVVNIQRQIQGDIPDCKEPIPAEEAMIKIPERRRIAEAAVSDPARFTGEKSLLRHIKCCRNMIALCKKRESRAAKTTSLPGLPFMDPPEVTSRKGPETPRSNPLKCRGFQCLFCMTSNLPSEDRQQPFKSKFSLQRHADRCRLNQFLEGDRIPCPDDLGCAGVVLNGKMHFKNHAARVHSFVL